MTRLRFVGALLLLLHVACSEGSQGVAFDRKALLQSLGEVVILPVYRDFESRTAMLQTAVSAFCAQPGAATLQTAREAWSNARSPWKQAEAVGFGPAMEPPWRLRSRIDFWPTDASAIEGVLTQTENLDSTYIAGLPNAYKGLPAIEYLLYQSMDIQAVVDSYGSDASGRRCDYLRLLSEDVAARASDLVRAWDPAGENYLGELVNAGQGSSRFSTLQSAVSEVVNQVNQTLQTIRDMKIGIPQGKKDGGIPQSSKVESPFSDRSLLDIQDGIQGVKNVYLGSYSGVQGIGLRDYVLARRASLDPSVQERLDQAFAAIAAVPGNLRTAVEQNPDAVETAYQAVKALQQIIAVDVANALGTTITFTDNDGD